MRRLITSIRRARKITVYGHGDDLLIVLSGANRPEGKFDFYKVLQGFPARRIYMNTPDNSFYHRGAFGFGETVEETLATLRRIVAQLRPRRVHIMGGSMGGYGALLFGALLRADTVIAFNAGYELPVAVLGQFVINNGSADTKYISLYRSIAKAETTRFYLVNSDNFTRDLHQAIGLCLLPNVTVLLHRESHNMVDLLRYIDIQTALSLLLAGNTMEFISRIGGTVLPPQTPAYIEKTHRRLQEAYDNDIQRVEPMFRIMEKTILPNTGGEELFA